MFTIYRHSLSTSGFKPLNDCLNKSVYTAVNKQAVNDRSSKRSMLRMIILNVCPFILIFVSYQK